MVLREIDFLQLYLQGPRFEEDFEYTIHLPDSLRDTVVPTRSYSPSWKMRSNTGFAPVREEEIGHPF